MPYSVLFFGANSGPRPLLTILKVLLLQLRFAVVAVAVGVAVPIGVGVVEDSRLPPRGAGAAMTWHGCAGIDPISGCRIPDDKYLPGRGCCSHPRRLHGALRKPGTSRPVVRSTLALRH